jgi:DNA-binding NtrC family response regulator
MTHELPPIRARGGDVPHVERQFFGTGWEIEPAAMEAMEKYAWPGNVRQLINVVERAKILAESEIVALGDLPREVSQTRGAASEPSSTASPERTDDLATIQRGKVVEVLRREAGNKSKAARRLGIDRRKLYRLLEKYRIGDAELVDSRS